MAVPVMCGWSEGMFKDHGAFEKKVCVIRRYSGEISKEKILFFLAMKWAETGGQNEKGNSGPNEDRDICQREQG